MAIAADGAPAPAGDPVPFPSPHPHTPPGTTRLQLVLALFVAVLLAGLLGFTTTRPAESEPGPLALGGVVGSVARDLGRDPAAPTTAEPTTTAGTWSNTTVVEDLGPLPDPLPSDPYAPTPQIVLGQIEIPKLAVVGNIQEGMTLTAINRGPGHWPGTPLPGGEGNMVIAGHRTTYSKPFARLDELTAGDKVVFRMPDGVFVYEVRGVIVVPAANIGIAAQTRGTHTATLFACHPRGSATHRIVAKLRLLGPDGRPIDADASLPPVSAGSDPHTGTTLLVRNTGAASGGDPLGAAGG